MCEIISHCRRSDRRTGDSLHARVLLDGLSVGHYQVVGGRRHLVRGGASIRKEVGHFVTSSRLILPGGVAEWLGRGLQSPPPRFESGRRLQDALFSGSQPRGRVAP